MIVRNIRILIGRFLLVAGSLGLASAQAAVDMNITSFQDVPGSVPAGGVFNYELTIENSGDEPAPNAALTVSIPAGTGFQSVTPGNCAFNSGAGQVECNFGTLAGTSGGGGSPVNVQIAVNTTVPGITTVSSTANVSTSAADSNAANNSSVQGTTIVAGADLVPTLAVAPNPVVSGGTATFTVDVQNDGPNDAVGLRVIDTLPPGVAYQSASGSGWSCSAAGQVVTCNHSATLASGATAPALSILVRVTSAAGTVSNSVTVSSSTADGDESNNTDSIDLGVGAGTDLSVSVAVDRDPVVGEQPVVFSVTVNNSGTIAADDVDLTDTLPAGYTINSASGSGWTCNVAGQTVTCTRATLGPGSSTVTIDATAPANASIPPGGGSETNTASVTTTTTDPVASNNTDSVNYTLVADGADLGISSPARWDDPAAIGGWVHVRMHVGNEGPRDASGPVFITSTLNANETFQSASGTNWDCSGSVGQNLICQHPGLNAGADSSTLEVVTLVTAAGTVNSTFCTSGSTTPSHPPAEGDPNPTNDCRTGNAVTASSTTADLVTTHSVSDTHLTISENALTYTVSVTNNGPDPSTNVTLTEQLPMWVSGTGVSTNVVSGTANCTPPTGQSLSCDLGTIANGATTTVEITLTRPMLDGSFTPRAAAYSADVGDLDRGNNQAWPVATTIDPITDVEMYGYTVTPDPVRAGVEATYVLSFRNNGPSAAGGVEVTNLFDTALSGPYTFVSATPSKGTCSFDSGTDTLTCPIGSMASGETQSVTLIVRPDFMASPPSPRTLNGTASVSTTTTESDATNNSLTVPLAITAALVEVLVNQSDEVDPVNFDPATPASNLVTYRVEVGNLGPSYATGVAFTDQITAPNGKQLTFLCDKANVGDACPPANQICTGQGTTITGPAAGTISCTVGNVAAGSTSVRYLVYQVITQPDATGDTVQSRVTVSSNEPESDAGNNTAFEQTTVRLRPSAISGMVFVDTNGNGIHDGGEPGIPGSTVTLSGQDLFGTSVNFTETTDANGAYSFEDMLASNASGYTLTQTQPSAWVDGPVVVGTLGGTVSGTNRVTGIVMPIGGSGTGYDFAETGGSLSGYVYNDLNSDGVKDGNEAGIPGVTLAITGVDSDGQGVSRSTTTGADGLYQFVGLGSPNASGYTLSETQPANANDGIETVGSLGGTVGNDVVSNIRFPNPGAVGTGYNFGESLTSIARIGGRVWLDTDHDRTDNEGRGEQDWVVELIQRTDPLNNSSFTLVASTSTDASGFYTFEGVAPGSGYEIRFRSPDGGYIYGGARSSLPGVDVSYGTIRNITLNAGDDITGQNLPIDPAGVVYDSQTRAPVAGATVRISGPAGFDPATHLVGGSANVSQLTGTSGFYQFLLFSTAPAGEYSLSVTQPSAGYLAPPSMLIPPCANTLSVGPTPDPAVVHTSASAPATSATLHDPAACPASSSALAAGAASTQYFLSFLLTPGASANVVNNQLPLDPLGSEALTVTVSTPRTNVSRGDLVPYTVTAVNNSSAALSGVDLSVMIPPGFRYQAGSARVDGVAVEPVMNGRQLTWPGFSFTPGEEHVIQLVTVVGAGVGDGDYTLQAWADDGASGARISNLASVKVRVTPDPTFDCSDVIGKVFDDRNANGYQDEGEPGVPNVRVSTVRGLLVTTDAQGRFHVTCAETPHQARGTNFIMKLDERSLPSGYRVTTENPRVIRLTAGKLSKLNFGVALHRVVRIDLMREAFNRDSTAILPIWGEELGGVIKSLKEKPSVLRIAYRLGEGESADDARPRVKALEAWIKEQWHELDCCYDLVIETELYQGQGQSAGGVE